MYLRSTDKLIAQTSLKIHVQKRMCARFDAGYPKCDRQRVADTGFLVLLERKSNYFWSICGATLAKLKISVIISIGATGGSAKVFSTPPGPNSASSVSSNGATKTFSKGVHTLNTDNLTKEKNLAQTYYKLLYKIIYIYTAHGGERSGLEDYFTLVRNCSVLK